MKTLIKGGRILDPEQNLDKIANLLIEDGKIVKILPYGNKKADRDYGDTSFSNFLP